MPDRWRVAVLDSGLADPSIVASCRFVDTVQEVLKAPVTRDVLGHGTEVSRVIRTARQSFDLINGQVLDEHGVTTPAALAEAIGWALDEGADLIHMSLGLRADRPVLAMAVDRAVKSGCIVVASSPARGECTFPARYPNVIRATGDGRCQRDEISALHSSSAADFGGCPLHMPRTNPADNDSLRFRGASLGAAHLTRFLIERIERGSAETTVRARLFAMARYRPRP